MAQSDRDAMLAERVRRMFDELLNRRRLEAITDYFAEDVVDHSPGPGQGPGRAGIADMIGRMLDSNPRLRVSVDDVVVQGDRVATRETWHTSSSVWNVAHFFRFANGVVVEEWSMGWGTTAADQTPSEDADR
jgi:predicted SnoaL-like aldol condensation-catalyzing enzyme